MITNINEIINFDFRVRCGTFLQEEDDDNIDSSKHIHQPQPSSHPLVNEILQYSIYCLYFH